MGVLALLGGYLWRCWQEDQRNYYPTRKFMALWEEKLTHVCLILFMFLLAFLVIGSAIKFVFEDVKEIERMTLLENTKSKLIDLAFMTGNLLMIHKEDSFAALSLFGLVMVFSNVHWLSTDRFKDHLLLNNLNSKFWKLVVFMGCYFLLCYSITNLMARAERMIFQILWFEVTYITIKQFKYLVLALCHFYYQVTGRTGFDMTLTSKLFGLAISTLTLGLKLYLVWTQMNMLMIYLYVVISSVIMYYLKVVGLINFLAIRSKLGL